MAGPRRSILAVSRLAANVLGGIFERGSAACTGDDNSIPTSAEKTLSPASYLAAGSVCAVFSSLALLAAAGCGNTYRPVVTPITITGPAAQPTALVAVVSSPGPAANGVVTILDFAGDSIDATAAVGINPLGLALDGTGAQGYTINSDSTLSIFAINSGLQTKNVTHTSLPPGTRSVNLLANTATTYLVDSNANAIDALQGTPPALRQAVPVGSGPITVVGSSGAQRVYAVSQLVSPGTCNTAAGYTTPGEVSTIETATNTVSGTIPVGICPVYAVTSTDNQRIFVLNRGSGTITVINGQTGVLDTNTVSFGGAGFNGTLNVGAGPVYGEFLRASSELLIANYDAGTISVIDVSTDVFGNDSANFGHTTTIPVGTHPAAVTVLQDGTRAYVANQGDGTISVVNLSSFTVERVIAVTGHPRSVYSVTNSLYSKVYVVCPDTSTLTVLRTDTDIISAIVTIQGNIVDVHPQTQTAGTNANAINVSRTSGSGQP